VLQGDGCLVVECVEEKQTSLGVARWWLGHKLVLREAGK